MRSPFSMQRSWIGCAVFFSASLAQAQLARHWVGHHDGPAHLDDYGYGTFVDSKGNLLVVGSATNSAGVTEILTVKFDAAGTKHWAQIYPAPGGGPDYGFEVACDAQDNIVVLGDSVGVGTDYDLVTLKYSPQGTLLWAQRYDGPAHGYDSTSFGLSLGLDASGNVFAGGYSAGVGTGYDSIVLKYTPAGVLAWEARYDGPTSGGDYCYGLEVDSAGNVCVTGETPDAGGAPDYLALKYDTNGNLLWQRQVDGPAHGADYVFSLETGPSNEVVITGFSDGVGTHDDVMTVKYDAAGNLEWVRRYDGPASKDDAGVGISVGAQGQVAVTGEVERAPDSAAVTLLYDASGNLLWAREHDVSTAYYGDDGGIDTAFDAAGNVYATGWGWGGPEFGDEAFLVQYGPDGTQKFADQYDGPVHGDDECFGVTVRGDDVFIAGLSQRGSRHLDAFAVKYGPEQSFGTPAVEQLLVIDEPTFAPTTSPRDAAPFREPRSPAPFRPRSHHRYAPTGRAGGR